MRTDTGRTAPASLRSRRGSALRLAALLTGVVGASSGCSRNAAVRMGWPAAVTKQGEQMLNLYIGSWIAALVIGVFVWGLIFYSVIRFRKRGDELPRQVRYNLPIEVLYTVVPFVIIAVLFYYTARVETNVDKLTKNPDVVVGVVGFQWNWQFNYPNDPQNPDDDIAVLGRPGYPAIMVLPVGRTIRFVETSPDVIHSFWVPHFLFKRDVIPGRANTFEITITKPGTFIGRCAELCGTDHDRMQFEVRAVSGADYDRFVATRGQFLPGNPLYGPGAAAEVPE